MPFALAGLICFNGYSTDGIGIQGHPFCKYFQVLPPKITVSLTELVAATELERFKDHHINNKHKQLVYLSKAKETQLCSVCLTA